MLAATTGWGQVKQDLDSPFMGPELRQVRIRRARRAGIEVGQSEVRGPEVDSALVMNPVVSADLGPLGYVLVDLA